MLWSSHACNDYIICGPRYYHCQAGATINVVLLSVDYIDREFEFYKFFSFLKFNEFYEFFFG